ncbi:hypothetical protein AAH978_15005 [Streptomyces sp. ZYX-F-203]
MGSPPIENLPTAPLEESEAAAYAGSAEPVVATPLSVGLAAAYVGAAAMGVGVGYATMAAAM